MRSKKDIKKFEKLIWDYYQKEGRVFPWRKTTNPYRILVSEVMLQQTQTSRVIKKYREFLKRFPSLSSLVSAPLGEVIATWQGLGYNRRAMYLHKAAKTIQEIYNRKIPSDYEKLIQLPGIGQSTAGAVCAFAFNTSKPFIETNIRRAVIHFFFPKQKDISDKKILQILNRVTPTKRAREWYWALMDYGAMLQKEEKENPNKRSKHYKKQSQFEGSRRQLRGKIIKELLNGGKTKKELQKKFGASLISLGELIENMKKEGLIKEEKRKFFLPK